MEGGQEGKALTLQLSATGRLVMSADTVVEAAQYIVSQQSAGTCVAHAEGVEGRLQPGTGWIPEQVESETNGEKS